MTKKSTTILASDRRKRNAEKEDKGICGETVIEKSKGVYHSFVLKDDQAYICRICGMIEKSIEQISDFQWGKFRTVKNSEQVEGSQFIIANASDQDFGAAEILTKLKVSILAHTPGSGKTVMIISFMQSFLANIPMPDHLEFERWQVEEIPQYGLYTLKADSREQQLDVFKQWVDHRGILFLRYEQFASIVSNSTSSTAAAACHDILLKVLTILNLDEGHRPRNGTTDVFYSLSQVQTPLEVTVIQNLCEMTGKVLHYYKGNFLDEFPGLVDLTVLLTLNPKQKHAVEKMRKLGRFKRYKGHINKAKIDELLNKVNITDGVKAQQNLTILALYESAGEKILGKELFVISGDSSQEQREISMERLNNSTDAMGASSLVILDIHLNPSVTRQAVDRAFRPGQTNKVYAYRLVAANSSKEEHHDTCFRKELILKMWFEFSLFCGYHDFAMEEANTKDLDYLFLDRPSLR
ncbi:hypothetical protein MKX01_029122 [Papaver californicum]|nr:hypothetical protein MKX01_029122 [Papaver californicum]